MQPSPAATIDKDALRRRMLGRRNAQEPELAARASQAVASRVEALPRYAAAREVLAYLPIRGEVDAGILVRSLLASGRRVLLPRCRPDAPGELDVGCLTSLDAAVPGRYGILEPPRAACLPPSAYSPDVILVPGVAFDAKGARLGFGGGYYDRLLALPMAASALTIGLAYAFQVVPQLPADPWDRPVDIVVTELQTYRFDT
ncbi:5-formyltetrahydrofolate cyclo-ligase [Solidesulfovibrio fructosivorans JJ]]|uniref:5-formyltetrahydrofolate cyclo-ligase n=1 Tax=Solidesulfovibrio fructosivorans JJ] TaxID=596151 RepID=E1JYS8_SOLFR|nr:5-formyltetrahydrofolate cyclo-ligase [Solidesulfovibrio fructosivorans]EFL50498.1 5-formyltetrahydrofolate cyclo-ligase [Solidesulfovibrio fructosivorans JJ]]